MASHHTRSLSFPSKPHPITDQLDEHLCRLKSSQAASTSSLTNKLTGLKDLYQHLDEFLQLPHNEKTLCEMLDGSLRLLDICATSRDVLEQSKERLQDIQSVLRRRCSGELNMTNEIVQYQKTRKTIKKIIKQCLKDIKEVKKCNEANDTESLLKDVQEVSFDVFKSLLSYIGGSQKSDWSLSLSKLVRQRAEKERAASISEFDSFDDIVMFKCQKKKASVDMPLVMKLESQIQEIEEVLECLFRQMIKSRAMLLNVLSN